AGRPRRGRATDPGLPRGRSRRGRQGAGGPRLRPGPRARDALRPVLLVRAPGRPPDRDLRAHPPRCRRAPGRALRLRVLAATELLVRDAVRALGLVPEPLAAPGLVGLEVPLEPGHLRIALEGEHVSGDA